MTVIPYDASELARILGGVRKGGTVLLAGEAGAGKSTVAAELAAAVAEERGGLSYWLDRDQQAHDLIATLFTRVNASMDRVVLVEERDPGEDDHEPLDWRGALTHVPGEAACVVRDSLETWAGSYGEQAELARAVSAHGAAVKLILCGTNAAGDVEGLARPRRAGASVLVLDAEGCLVKKFRWLPDCPPAIPAEGARGSRAACPPLDIPELALRGHDRRQHTRQLLTLVFQTFARLVNHHPRRDRGGRSRIALYNESVTAEHIDAVGALEVR